MRGSWHTAALAIALCSSMALAGEDEKQQPEEEVDHVSLAALLVKDGHFDRAESVLREVKLDQPGLDLARLYTLRGLLHLKKQRFVEARTSFQEAIAAGQKDEIVYVYLAQAHFGAKDYKGVVGAFRKAGAVGKEEPDMFALLAQSHWELKQYEEALQTLGDGKRAFPEHFDFDRMRIYYLVDLKLYQEVVRLSKGYLARGDTKVDDYLGIGEALRKAKEFDKARSILGAAQLKYPGNEKVMLQLAHCYLDEGRVIPAAMLFEDASRLDPKYALEAAELYKRAGVLDRALRLNERVGGQKEKIKQRLSILLEMRRYEMVAGMGPRLSRLGLLSDQNIRYALAYALYQVGEHAEAETHLKKLTDPKLFKSALQLRRAMESCQNAGWECQI